MDEISGRGKSMFMLTAIGTAVILETPSDRNNSNQTSIESGKTVSSEKINFERNKRQIIEWANTGKLKLSPESGLLSNLLRLMKSIHIY